MVQINRRDWLRPLAAGMMVLAALVGSIFTVSADNNYGNGTYGSCQYGSCSITLSSSGTVNLDIAPTTTGNCTIASDSVSVLTDNSSGYNLTFQDTAASSALDSGGPTIPASSATFASPATLANNTWGYRVDGAGSFGAGPTSAQSNGPASSLLFAAVPTSAASPDTLANTSGPANPAVITTVWYGVCTTTATPSGSYSTQVIYTATAN